MFTEFDVLVCVIILISTVASLMSGFIKDLLSLVGWIAAATATLYFYPWALSHMSAWFGDSLIVSGIVVIILFIVVLLIISLITSMIMDNLRMFRQGAIDRTLGFLFGALKGIAIVSVIHFSIVLVAEEAPEWLKKGETYPLTSEGSKAIAYLTEDWIEDKAEIIKDEDKNAIEKLEEGLLPSEEDEPEEEE